MHINSVWIVKKNAFIHAASNLRQAGLPEEGLCIMLYRYTIEVALLVDELHVAGAAGPRPRHQAHHHHHCRVHSEHVVDHCQALTGALITRSPFIRCQLFILGM